MEKRYSLISLFFILKFLSKTLVINIKVSCTMLIDEQKLVTTDKDCTPLQSKALIKKKSISINSNFESNFFSQNV